MSKAELTAPSGISLQYQEWLRQERRGRIAVRATQLALLVIFLVVWEVLPKTRIINPVLTSYPSALWPTFLELLHDTPRQAGILTRSSHRPPGCPSGR